MEFPTLDCSNLTAGELVETQVCFTSSDPSNPMIAGQFIAIDDITNCLDDTGNEWLPDFLANVSYDPTYDEAGFGPAFDDMGTIKICATFHLDPATLVQANVISDTNPTGTVVRQSPCPTIPSMGQWALFILGLFTSCLALAYIHRESTEMA